MLPIKECTLPKTMDDIDWIVEETILDIEQNPNWRIAIITRIKIAFTGGHAMQKKKNLLGHLIVLLAK